jgi:hypothetical protein
MIFIAKNKLGTPPLAPCGRFKRLAWRLPQGSSVGLLEYDSQSNTNTELLSVEDKFKFVDHLSTLEVINLIMAGLTSYNFKQHVASDIGTDNLYSENIQSQKNMDLK